MEHETAAKAREIAVRFDPITDGTVQLHGERALTRIALGSSEFHVLPRAIFLRQTEVDERGYNRLVRRIASAVSSI